MTILEEAQALRNEIEKLDYIIRGRPDEEDDRWVISLNGYHGEDHDLYLKVTREQINVTLNTCRHQMVERYQALLNEALQLPNNRPTNE